MNYLLGAIAELWTNFYNKVIRDASSTVKGAVIGVLVVVTLLLLAIAMKSQGKGDGSMINNWTAFWLGIFSLGLLVLYCFLVS